MNLFLVRKRVEDRNGYLDYYDLWLEWALFILEGDISLVIIKQGGVDFD